MNAARPSKGKSPTSGNKSSKASKADYGKVKKGYSGESRKPDDDDF